MYTKRETLIYNNQIFTIKAASIKFKIDYNVLMNRICNGKYTDKEAIETPLRKSKKGKQNSLKTGKFIGQYDKYKPTKT